MFLVVFVFILTLVYYLIRQAHSYWQKKNVVVPATTFFVGNIGPSVIGRKSLGDIYTDVYRNYQDHAFVGIYQFLTPCLIVRDIELIKNITVRDFKHFTDNHFEVDKQANILFSHNPFALKGEEWKRSRSQLTPCLSSGRVKAMFPILKGVAERMIKFLNDGLEDSSLTAEARDVSVRFTVDNVAACVFALDGKAFQSECSEFRKIADTLFVPGTIDSIKVYISVILPKLTKILHVSLVSQESEKKLIEITKKALEIRKKSNVVREDFLDSVIAISESNSNLSEIDIAAQCAIFFSDGYETSSRVMSFVLFELASNPEIQTKLRNEINRKLQETKGEFSYEAINEMSYLDACYMENLRKNSIMKFLLKTCTETYSYTPDSKEYKSTPVTIEKGTCILLPIHGIHTDARYYDNPDKYIPERFLDKEIHNKYTFLALGQGPRACMGQRFAATQIKIGVAQIVKNFELKVNSKTQLPLKYDPWFLMNHPIGGLWLDFKKIETSEL